MFNIFIRMSLLDTSDTVWNELDAQIHEQAIRDAIHRCMKRITYKDMYKELPDPNDHEPGSVIGIYHGKELESYILLDIRDITGTYKEWHLLSKTYQKYVNE